MPFISPMLASATPTGWDFLLQPNNVWFAEEKFDGHRLIVEKRGEPSDLFSDTTVRAWSRYRLPRVLPRHVSEAIGKLPDGIYDGELIVPGDRSYGVTELSKTKHLVFTCFDVLRLLDNDTLSYSYIDRRAFLAEIFSREHIQDVSAGIRLAESRRIDSFEAMRAWRDEVWARDGEGLILKRGAGVYRPGKRSKDFLKVKALRTAVLRVVAFLPSGGQIINRGRYAVVLLEDEDGNRVTVKTRNDDEIARLEARAGVGKHPDIGRLLRIEYQERTPDGSYRHPRWDRWEDE